MLSIVPAVVFLNRDALNMQGVYPDYVCFRDAILAGLNPTADQCQSPTFPMWGYGWLLLLTRDQVVLLVLQNVLAVAAAWVFLRTLELQDVLVGRALRVVKLALVLSVPWYALHSVRWPYSEAVSMLLVS